MTEQKEPKLKYELLMMIANERRSLDKVIEELSEAQLLERAFEGGLSIKDLVAHITDWEQRMMKWIFQAMNGEVPESPAPDMRWDDLDTLKHETYFANEDDPLMKIMMTSLFSYGKVVVVVKKLTDEDLFDRNRFDWLNGDPLWHMVAANTWWHYREHRQQIEAWLKG